MSLRLRITGLFLLLIAGAITAGTFAHVAEVSRQLEGTLRQQAARVVASIETETEQTASLLDEELALAAQPGRIARWLGDTGQGRLLGARARLQSGRVEILKVLSAEGEILTSGHWPSSFGALDPLITIYASAPGPTARIVDEATPEGQAPSLQRWTVARWRGRDVLVVAGRFLDTGALERIRATVGADIVGLCRESAGASKRSRSYLGREVECVGAGQALSENPRFDHTALKWRSRYVFKRIALGASDSDSTFLVAGLDRAPIADIRDGIVMRALGVGAISVIVALLLGFILATRIVRPVEALADAAGRLAEGELQTRVELERNQGGREVNRLVESFNLMATEIERSQQELVRAERVAAWREIARGLAHELKNPLTPIRGAMDVIRRAYRLEREDFGEILDEQAGAVVEEVDRLKELSDAFARFARLPDPHPEPLDVGEVLDRAALLYAGEGSDVEVARDYDPALKPVNADRTQLQTAVTNLIKNAVEAMDGKGTLHLAARKVEVGEGAKIPMVEIHVGDSGPGIADEVKDRLFTPYVTTKGSRGTGLGLALVHRIVIEHGGSIQVGESPAGGADFIISLPLNDAAQGTPSRGEA